MFNFYKNFIFLCKNLFFFSNKAMHSKQIFKSPFKKFNSVKKKFNSVKTFILFKQTHSV